MQPKSSVEVDGAVGLPGRLNGNGWTELVVELFEEWHDHIQTIGRTALEDRHQDLPLAGARSCCTNQPRRRHADAGHRHSGGAKKEASCEHPYLLWKSGEPRTNVARIEG